MYALPQKKMQRWVMNDKNLRHGYPSNNQYQRSELQTPYVPMLAGPGLPRPGGIMVLLHEPLTFALGLKTWSLKPFSDDPAASPSKSPSASGFFLDFETLLCHPSRTGRKCHRSNSGQRTSRKTISVSSSHCQSIKSLRRSTPDVRTSKSRGGLSFVCRWSDKVCRVIVSGDKNAGVSDSALAPWVAFFTLILSWWPARSRVVDDEKAEPVS